MRISNTIYITALGVLGLCATAWFGYCIGRSDAAAYTQQLSIDQGRRIHQIGFDLGYKFGEYSCLTELNRIEGSQ